MKTITLGTAVIIIIATGIDLIYIRAGVGIFLLGLWLFCATITSYQNEQSPSLWLVLSLALGGLYFVARGISAGPLAFQASDGTLILCTLLVVLSILCLELRSIISVTISIVILGGINAVWGIIQLFNISQGEGIKMTGMFGHYNLFAAFMNISFFGALSFVLESRRSPKFRFFFGMLSLLVLAAIFYSGSRGGWVAFLAGGGVFGVAYLTYLKLQESKYFGPVLFAFVFAVVAGGITLSYKLEDTSRSRGSNDTSSFFDGGRVIYQQWGVDFFLKNPIVGNGPRSFEHMAEQNWKLDEIPHHAPDPDFVHNEFIQLLTDYGIIGFIIVMLILFICGVKGLISFVIPSEEDDGKSEMLIAFALAATASLLVQSFFSFLMHTPTMVTLLGLCIAVLHGTGRKTSRSILASGLMIGISGLAMFGGGLLSGALFYSHVSNDSISHKIQAAKMAFDSEMAERAGVEAHSLSLLAQKEGDSIGAQELIGKAMEAFTIAEKLNPHSLIAICSQARILDEMERHQDAYPVHLRAIEKGKSREFFLRPYFFAARNRVYLGIAAFEKGEKVKGELLFREANLFLTERREISGRADIHADSRELFYAINAWLTYFEGQRLYREGDLLWKKRDSETGFVLMLEAEKRYLAARKLVEPHDSLWAIQFEQLQKNLIILKGANIVPAQITAEEIERIAKGLESPAEKQ